MPGQLTPRLQESLVRLCTWIPSFAKATAELAWFTQAQVHPDTARRLTEGAGATAVALDTTAAERGGPVLSVPAESPDTLVFSVDGAMVPLVHGQWAEVRTLAVGTVEPPVASAEGPVVHTTALSYFSRLTDSTTFAELAWPELHRRGMGAARRVGAVVDGAEWCQSFIDWNHPQAIRILDFPHAAEYVTTIGQMPGPTGPLLAEADRDRLRHALKHTGPEPVLSELRALVAAHPTLPDLAGPLAYLEKRVAQMQYPQFVADGWPIGSGMVESANKLVVEDRLKGAGMHWANENVNPLLALRNVVCNDRWAEVWPQIEAEQRCQQAARRRARRQRRPARAEARPTAPPRGVTRLAPTYVAPTPLTPPPTPGAVPKDRRPAAHHPWRKAWSVRRQRAEARVA